MTSQGRRLVSGRSARRRGALWRSHRMSPIRCTVRALQVYAQSQNQVWGCSDADSIDYKTPATLCLAGQAMGNVIGQLDCGCAYAGHMNIRPKPSGLSAARRQIRAVALELNFNKAQVLDLQVAAGEAISNAYLHGSPDPGSNFIRVSWHFADDVLTVAVMDEGGGFVPDAARRRRRQYPGSGRCGIELMRACVDEVDFLTEQGAKVVLRMRSASHLTA